MAHMSAQDTNTTNKPRPDHNHGRPAVRFQTFHPSRENILVGFVMFLISLIFTGYNVTAFFWIPLLPLLFIVWVIKAETRVDEQGITAKPLIRPSKTVAWQDFQGIRFNKAGKAYAAAKDDSQFWLPGITFNSLPALAEATAGRIPDPLTPARLDIHNKVQVVHRDGSAVLMDSEDYAEYEKQRRAEHEAEHPTAAPSSQTDSAASPEDAEDPGTGSTSERARDN